MLGDGIPPSLPLQILAMLLQQQQVSSFSMVLNSAKSFRRGLPRKYGYSAPVAVSNEEWGREDVGWGGRATDLGGSM